RNHGAAGLNLTLDRVAQRLLSTCRKSDHVARLNEQSLVVLMPGTGAAEIQLVGERIERALNDLVSPSDHKAQDLDLVLGIAALQQSDTVESLIRRAEIELFHGLRVEVAAGVE